jgi:hypothetical protein
MAYTLLGSTSFVKDELSHAAGIVRALLDLAVVVARCPTVPAARVHRALVRPRLASLEVRTRNALPLVADDVVFLDSLVGVFHDHHHVLVTAVATTKTFHDYLHILCEGLTPRSEQQHPNLSVAES